MITIQNFMQMNRVLISIALSAHELFSSDRAFSSQLLARCFQINLTDSFTVLFTRQWGLGNFSQFGNLLQETSWLVNCYIFSLHPSWFLVPLKRKKLYLNWWTGYFRKSSYSALSLNKNANGSCGTQKLQFLEIGSNILRAICLITTASAPEALKLGRELS